MRAVTFEAIETLAVSRLNDPRLEEPGDAIVAVHLAGICGSDLHVYHGRERGIDAGTVMGHEFVGEVIETASGVERLLPGARVTSPFTTSCGDCAPCRQGLTARCHRGQLFGWREQGAGLHGGQAELVRVPLADSTLVEIPEDISEEYALLAGDVLSTGYFCARQGGVKTGMTVAVIGCGPVGLMAILAARYLGAGRIFAVDPVPERLEFGQRCGAEPLAADPAEAVAALHDASKGLGSDVVLEAVGSGPASRLALDLVRPGGTISVVGVHTEPTFAFSPVEAYDKNLTYRIGRCSARHYLDAVLPLSGQWAVDPSSIVSHRLPLASAASGYDLFARRQPGCTKVVLSP